MSQHLKRFMALIRVAMIVMFGSLAVMATPAISQTHQYYQNSDGTVSPGMVINQQVLPRYQLLGTYGGSGASSSGAAVGPVQPGAYVFACSGTIGGGTITLQVLGPDGATFQTVSGISFTSLPNSIGVVMPNILGKTPATTVSQPNAQAVLTGATGASVFCSLS